MIHTEKVVFIVEPRMHETLSNLVERLDGASLIANRVIPWSCPVPSFGDLSNSAVATLGLNPSNREFVDGSGFELDGPFRRLHTLRSLGIRRWGDAESKHLKQILKSCREYFTRNPYDGWFRALDQLLIGTGCSYYSQKTSACHLDLIPYATSCKWTELLPRHRAALLALAGDTLGMLVRKSSVRLLVLNGRSVVENLQRIAEVEFDREEMDDWTLPRNSRNGVVGIAYRGTVRQIGGVKLGRSVQVLGFNHNIQSSFGVTNQVKAALQKWISDSACEVLM